MHHRTQNKQLSKTDLPDQLELAAALVSRLERLSADFDLGAPRQWGARGTAQIDRFLSSITFAPLVIELILKSDAWCRQWITDISCWKKQRES